jgi:antitoxin (DNA-binding transcriptional repressor) of toxin-antitoxin stability system
MKFLTVRDLRSKSAQIWKELIDEQEMVVTNNGRPVAILSATNESNLETSLNSIRRARLADAISSIQEESIGNNTNKITHDEIDEEIQETRKTRKR